MPNAEKFLLGPGQKASNSSKGKSKIALLALLQELYPQFSKEHLYARILCGEVRTRTGQTLRDAKQLFNIDTELHLQEKPRYVSRGGEKLQRAIEEFAPLGFLRHDNTEKLVVLDAGASSGGFTDCLLQHGCDIVYAVDSGKNQLDFKLRRDARVNSFEGYKIQDFLRDLPNSNLPSPDYVVMDISFRSILGLLPLALRACRRRAGVFLCKPQFEWQAFCQAQPEYRRHKFDGIIKDSVSLLVFNWFCEQLRQTKEPAIELLGYCPSPLRGGRQRTSGNLEYLSYLQLA